MRPCSMKPVVFPMGSPCIGADVLMARWVARAPVPRALTGRLRCVPSLRQGCLPLLRIRRRRGALLPPLGVMHLGNGPPVLGRQDLEELAARCAPMVQEFARALAAGPAVVLLQQLFQQGFVGLA